MRPVPSTAARLRFAVPFAVLALAPLAARANPADLLPPTGPYGSAAVPFAPAVPGAAEAAAADYLRPDGRRLGALLAATAGPGYDGGAILSAFAGGTPSHTRPVLLRGYALTLVTHARPGEAPVYAVGFAATREGAYRDAAAEGDTHVVAWSDAEEAALALAGAALDHLAASALLPAHRGASAVTALAAVPNPSSGTTALRFTLSDPADVRVAVYDALGRRVAALAPGRMPAGPHTVPFEASALAPGVYVVHLTAGAAAATQRLTRR